MSAPAVSIVIPFYNRRDEVTPCIRSLLRQENAPSYEIIAVDNGSDDGTRQALERLPVRLIDCQERGPASARNAGIAAAQAPLVALIDSDCVAHRHWLHWLTRAFDNPQVLACGGWIGTGNLDKGVSLFAHHWGLLNQANFFRGIPGWPPYFATANVAFRRDQFILAGGFDPTVMTGEDADLCWRLMNLGGSLVYQPRARILHRHRESFDGMYRQAFDYGVGAARLHAKYPAQLGRVSIYWRWYFALAMQPLLAPLVYLFEKDRALSKWHLYESVWLTGYMLGRWRGSLKYKVLCV